MKTLKIEIPAGYEIDTEKSTFEQIVFKEIKKELPKSWEELGVIEGYWVQSNSISSYSKRKTIGSDHKNVFKTKEQAQASIALAQLSQLREVYRQGWKPDWKNTDTKHAVIKLNEILTTSFESCYPKFLSFQSREIAEQFLKNFKDLIEEASPLLFGE
jgi:hypothetical protein